MSSASRIEGIAGGSRGVGGISGGGGKNVNPVYKELGSSESRASLAASENKKAIAQSERIAKNNEVRDKAISELRRLQGWKKATPAESQAVKTAAQKNSIERAKKGMG